MSLSQGGGQLPSPSVIPEFQGDVGQMTSLANSLGGQTVAPGAFTPSAGTNAGATVGNNYFGAGGAGNLGIAQLSNILSGNNLNPASNPYLQDNISTMQQAFTKTLGGAEDSINAQFAGSGQTGNSGAKNNAMSMMGTNAMQDFSNSLTGFLGNNYEQGQGQITSALGLIGQPLAAAGAAGGLSQEPGQLQYQGQNAQNALTEVPFNLLDTIMKDAPIANAAYAPSSPSDAAGYLNLAEGKGSGGQSNGGGQAMAGLAQAFG